MSHEFVAIYRLVIRENYRQSYDETLVQSIADNMQAHGFSASDPIEVYRADGTDELVVIDGHTRYTAALQACLYGVWVLIRDEKPDNKTFKLQQLAKNELRVDPDDMSKAIGYQQAINNGASVDELCAAIGKRRDYVEKRLALLALNAQNRELVAKRQLSIEYAYTLTQLDSNRQNIAMRLFASSAHKTLETFKAIVSELYAQQVAESQSAFSWGYSDEQIKAIEEKVISAQESRVLSRSELERQLAAERAARAQDRAFARQKYAEAQKLIAELQAQLAQKVA